MVPRGLGRLSQAAGALPLLIAVANGSASQACLWRMDSQRGRPGGGVGLVGQRCGGGSIAGGGANGQNADGISSRSLEEAEEYLVRGWKAVMLGAVGRLEWAVCW